MAVDNNILGTVIYEKDNPSQQSLIIKDLRNDQTQEFPLNNGRSITHEGKNISLSNILSEKSVQQLDNARMTQENTSFMLSPSELEKVSRLNLTETKDNINDLSSDISSNDEEEKKGSLLDLKEQYKNLQQLVKVENNGELTEENLVNRLTAENQYRDSKNDVMEKFNVPSQTITKMERNVRETMKSRQNELNM